MPKVSEAYREARRDKIARAAIQRLSKQGFSGTSMADIIDESGMSAGAIYSHFASKAEIAQHVARMVVGTRAEELVASARSSDPPLDPAQIVSYVLEATRLMGIQRVMLLQVWAEATVDPEFRAIIDETVGRLRAAYGEAITPWLRARGRQTDAATIRALADTMVAVSQGFVVNSALFGRDDPEAYLSDIAELFGN